LANIIGDVRAFLRENFMLEEAATLDVDASFIDNHVLDSTGFMELVAFIEEKYGIQTADEELVPENFESLANVEKYVQRKQSEVTS